MRFAVCLLSFGIFFACSLGGWVRAQPPDPTVPQATTEPATKPRKARSVVIILDGSGSMAGNIQRRASACAAEVISGLANGDRFNVGISRKDDTKFLFPKSLEPATAARIADAKDFVLDRYVAKGSSDVARAIVGAFSVSANEIVVITDGDIGDGPALVEKLKQLHHDKPSTRVLVKHLVQGPARATDGEMQQQERIMRRIAEVTEGDYARIDR